MKIKILLKIGLMAMCLMAGFVEMEAQELFQKEYGFTNRNDINRQQFPSTVIQSQDSGFAVINISNDVPGQNPFVRGGIFLKTNKYGEVQWSKYLHTSSDFDAVFLYSIIQTSKGSYYISGRIITGQTPTSQTFILKTDINGNKLWIKHYKALPERSIIFRTLAETTDNCILLLGASLLCKIDTNGNCLWAKQYSQYFNVIKSDSDSTFVLAGNGFAQIDTAGKVLWAKDYGFWSGGFYIKHLKNGGFGLVTNRGSVVSKTDEVGNILWSKVFNYVQLNPAVIDEFASGDLIVAGTYGTPAEGQYGWITILDSLGNLLNPKFLTRPAGSIFSGVVTYDNCFVMESAVLIKGFKENVSALLQIDSKGNTSCPEKEKVMYLTIEDYPIRDSVLAITDSLIQITASDLPCEFISVDITATDLCAPTNILEEDQTGDFQLYPNPASGICTILLKEDIQNADISIIDMHGKTLHRKFLKNAEGEIMLDISPLQPGVYFVKVIADGREFMQKMIVE